MTDPGDPGDLPTEKVHEPPPCPPSDAPTHPEGAIDWLGPVDAEETEACPDTVVHRSSELDELATNKLGATRATPPPLDEQATRRGGLGPLGFQKEGQRIGRFRVRRQLGAGAFGKVYLAEDPQLDRAVAIKVAKMGLWPSDEDRRRFLREARAAAQLRHPHIVPVYEFGQVGDADYIAYQYVPGTTLRHVLSRQQKISVRQAVDLATKIASALHYAHTKQIVHRDVKPENILMDEDGQPHVADFGCARREDSGGLLTVEGQVMGTPAYMSPEQAAGQARLADGRADVWSVGVMLEEMLTGQRPFRGTLTELLVSIREREPKPIRQVDSRLPRDLETICQKCLAKDPNERFPTALYLQQELERFQRGEPILSRRISVWARTWRWARRNRTVAALLAGIVVTFAVAAMVSTFLWWQVVSAQRERARDLGSRLLTAMPQNLGLLLDEMRDSAHRGLVQQPLLAEMRSSFDLSASESFQRTAARAPLGLIALGLTPKEERAASQRVLDQMLRTTPSEIDELTALRDGLQQTGSRQLSENLSQRLWQQATELQQAGTPRLQVFATLAAFDPLTPRWNDFTHDVTDRLLATDPLLLPQWLDALAPLRDHCRNDLRQLFHHGTVPQQQSAARAIARWFAADPEYLTEYFRSATPQQLEPLLDVLRDCQASERAVWRGHFTAAANAAPGTERERTEPEVVSLANCALALYGLGQWQVLREGFQAVHDPSLRSELVPRVAASGMEIRDIWDAIDRATSRKSADDAFVSSTAEDREVASWILALGSIDPGRQFAAERDLFIPRLKALARQHADPGVFGAARWAIEQWTQTAFDVPRPCSAPARAAAARDRPSWRWNREGIACVALGPVPQFVMGSPPAEQKRFYPGGLTEIEQGEKQREVSLDYRFEIAACEVTAYEFQAFEQAWTEQLVEALSKAKAVGDVDGADDLQGAIDFHKRQCDKRAALVRDEREPVRGISWYDALAYCRWLTELEDGREADRCYASLTQIAVSASLADPIEPLQGLVASRAYRLPTAAEWEYAARAEAITPWYWGRFERRGNEYCWITQSYLADSLRPVARKKPNRFGLFDMAGNVTEWCLNKEAGPRSVRRELRGGSYLDPVPDLRSARVFGKPSDLVFQYVGFRIARTVTTGQDSLD